MKQKKIIGITGGVGAGKSSVLAVLKNDFGAKIILADLVAHDLMEPGSLGLRKVTEALGTSFLTPDGAVDRKALADLIFRDKEALKTMNSIIHPLVWKTMKEEAEAASENLVIIEAAVFDTAPKNFFDELWYVYTTKENRIVRLMENRGYMGTEIHCRVVVGGELSDRKSMSFPHKVLEQVYLSEQDKDDLLFGIRNGIDFVAASFVSRRQDVLDVRNFLDANGGQDIEIIAKIENQTGIDNVEEICEVCSGIMIGRGDLGVEVPFAELPAIQKYLITKCRLLGKRVITATEMLESMIHNPRPTRAEISDVANAVYDGTSAVMLSGESAAGKYPVKTVQTMAEIVEETEKHIDYETLFRKEEFQIKNMVDAISHATCCMACDIGAKTIVVSSLSGATVRMVSRFRVPVDIVGMATNERVWYRLALSWGVQPILCEETFTSTDVLFYNALHAAKKAMHLHKGDNIVMTAGNTNGASGNTNLIKVETI